MVVPHCLQSCLCFLLVKKHRQDLSNPEPHLHPNYRLGGKLCSGLCNKLTGAAAQWWDDYAKSGKPRPNCWKRATDPLFVPAGLVEVSLYDLLASQFDPTVDAQQAELELDSYRWDPLDKKALGLVPFRGHVSRLCTRAGCKWGSGLLM